MVGLRVQLYGRKDTLDSFLLYGVDIQFAIHVMGSFSYGDTKTKPGNAGIVTLSTEASPITIQQRES